MEVILFAMRDLEKHRIDEFDASLPVEKLRYAASRFCRTPDEGLSILTENGVNLSVDPTKPVLSFIPEGTGRITLYVFSGDPEQNITLPGEASVRAVLQEAEETESPLPAGRHSSASAMLCTIEKLALLIDHSHRFFVGLLEALGLFRHGLLALLKNLQLISLLYAENLATYHRLHEEASRMVPLVRKSLPRLDSVVRFFESTRLPSAGRVTLMEWFRQNVCSTAISTTFHLCESLCSQFQQSYGGVAAAAVAPIDVGPLELRFRVICECDDVLLYFRERVELLSRQIADCASLRKVVRMTNDPGSSGPPDSATMEASFDTILSLRQQILLQERENLDFLSYFKGRMLAADAWIWDTLHQERRICASDKETTADCDFLTSLLTQSHFVAEIIATPIIFSRLIVEIYSRASFNNDIQKWVEQAHDHFEGVFQREHERQRAAHALLVSYFVTRAFNQLHESTVRNPIELGWKRPTDENTSQNYDLDYLQQLSAIVFDNLQASDPSGTNDNTAVNRLDASHQHPVDSSSAMSPPDLLAPTAVISSHHLDTHLQDHDSGLTLDEEEDEKHHHHSRPHQVYPLHPDSNTLPPNDDTSSELVVSFSQLQHHHHHVPPPLQDAPPNRQPPHSEKRLLESTPKDLMMVEEEKKLREATKPEVEAPTAPVKTLKEACEAYHAHIQGIFSVFMERMKREANKREQSLMESVEALRQDKKTLSQQLKDEALQRETNLWHDEVAPGRRALFIYDHRSMKYFIPRPKPDDHYFLCTDDPIYQSATTARPPLLEAVVASMRLVQIRLPENRFKLSVGSVFYLVKRLLPEGKEHPPT